MRLFVSSPGDVALERELARQVVHQLQATLSGELVIEDYFWEWEPMDATRDFQENIPDTADFDIVVSILWSRLGSPLSEKHSVGLRPWDSGTDKELTTALEAWQRGGCPDVRVFINSTEPTKIPRDPALRARMLEQYDRLRLYLQRRRREVPLSRRREIFHRYATLSEFRTKLEVELHGMIERRRAAGHPGERPDAPAALRGEPYRGLQPLSFEDSAIYFGRTDAVDRVLNLLSQQAESGRAFVLVVGMSGSGKSSLVHAGVLPLLMEPGVMGGDTIWRRASMRPGDGGRNPFRAFAAALTQPQALPELEADPGGVETLAQVLAGAPGTWMPLLNNALTQAEKESLHEREERLRLQRARRVEEGRIADVDEIDRRLADLTAPAARLVLVVDQFEELFTADHPSELRAAFVAALAALAQSGMVYVLATLRADFFHWVEELPELSALKAGKGQFDLLPPTGRELGQMIRLPALAAGLRFGRDPRGVDLDEILREAVVRDPGALPLLGFALKQLYESRTPDGVLTYESFVAGGELERAIAQRAEETFASLSFRGRWAFGEIMQCLVTITPSGEQRIAGISTTRARLNGIRGGAAFTDGFVAARLFTAGSDATGEPTVSLAHEALLRHWPRLQKWVAENERFLKVRSHLQRATVRWSADRKAEYLLPKGKPLREAKQVARRHRRALSDDEKAFVKASVRRARRGFLRRWALVAIPVGLLVIPYLIIWSIGGLVGLRLGLASGAELAARQDRAAYLDVLMERAGNDPRLLLAYADESEWLMKERAVNQDFTEAIDRGRNGIAALEKLAGGVSIDERAALAVRTAQIWEKVGLMKWLASAGQEPEPTEEAYANAVSVLERAFPPGPARTSWEPLIESARAQAADGNHGASLDAYHRALTFAYAALTPPAP